MSAPSLTLLAVNAEQEAQALAAMPGFVLIPNTGAPTHACDAVLHRAANSLALARLCRLHGLSEQAYDSAVVVIADEADDELERELFGLGVEAIVAPGPAPALARELRHAVQRKRVERAARTAYATDLATGLPHKAQLLEHMSHLLALREREPGPMVLIVLRVDGLMQAAARFGEEAANVLRRKLAVRLRSGLRASDVVAALGSDMFGVLLSRLDAFADGERVAAKLARVLQQPMGVAGQPCPVSASIGVAAYPAHGKDAGSLLKRAMSQAAGLADMGREGFASSTMRAHFAPANDEDGAAG